MENEISKINKAYMRISCGDDDSFFQKGVVESSESPNFTENIF